MAASAAEYGYSATFGIDDGASGHTAVAEVYSITPPGYSRDAIDVTHLDSDDEYREFIAGIMDAGEVGLELNYIPSASHALLTALEAGKQSYQITLPLAASTVTCTFDGIMTSFAPGAVTVDDKMTASATLKVSGKPVWA